MHSEYISVGMFVSFLCPHMHSKCTVSLGVFHLNEIRLSFLFHSCSFDVLVLL